MKKVSGILMFIVLFVSIRNNLNAQQIVPTVVTKSIEPYKIMVAFNKTSNLIFPYAIKSVDRGSVAILAQKAKAVENILQVKAGQQGFASTNLSVVTADGRFYSFIVNYAAEPSPLNMSFNVDTIKAQISEATVNEAELETLSNLVKSQQSFLHRRLKEQRMKLLLNGIYLSDTTMWFKLKLENQSLIDYKPENIRFVVRDRKRSKRTAVQENNIQPVYAQPSFVVRGNTEHDFIYGFNPFTIPSNQEFIVQITEASGGRALLLRISPRVFLKARLLKN